MFQPGQTVIMTDERGLLVYGFKLAGRYVVTRVWPDFYEDTDGVEVDGFDTPLKASRFRAEGQS